ncbi:MAG: hypothetical protein S4CHLAM2_16990 [Chlamydiales bacterium]|nr:hypothetical protein [Chlamydiales bacterium]
MASSSTRIFPFAQVGSCLAASSDKARAAKYVAALAAVTALGGVLCLFIASMGAIPPWTAQSLGYAGSLVGVVAMTVALVSSAVFVYIKRFSAPCSVSGSPPQAPVAFSPRYRLCRSTIYIDVVKQDVGRRPRWHLNQLVPLIERSLAASCSFSVKFYTAEGVRGVGVDGGALSREYIGHLFTGLREHSEVKWEWKKGSKLYVPRANQSEVDLFCKMGQVMLYCLGHVPLGSHFDLSVFEVVFGLSGEEIRTPFSQLPQPTKLRMCLSLCKGIDQKKRVVELLLQRSLNTDQLAEMKQLAKILELSVEEGDEALIKTELLDCLSEDYDNQLRALHALAVGLRFDRLRNTLGIRDAADLCLAIQGSVNADCVASSLIYLGNNAEIIKKVGWLQEWCLDSSRTTSELQEFLLDLTGATALASGFVIQVEEQRAPFYPCPKVRACGNPHRRSQGSIELSPVPCSYGDSNDHTKENFIASLILVRTTRESETGYSDA